MPTPATPSALATRSVLILGLLTVIFCFDVEAMSPSQGKEGPAASSASGEEPSQDEPPAAAEDSPADDAGVPIAGPMFALVVGVAIVLGLIIGARVNAFIALISAAIAVSLLAPGAPQDKIQRVATAFGGSAGGIGIVIAMAAVIGKCMLDSGAADRIVRAFVGLLGEKRAPWALMASGYVLAVPVFFDTVFYLLVPLARSLYRRTRTNYLKYILAIAAGGAITHSLVPPTPGPLLMASTLNVDPGVMILIGALVAFPAAIAGVVTANFLDATMPIPMRPMAGEAESGALESDQLPSLAVSLAPVLLPVVLISTNTVLNTLADLEPSARVRIEDVRDWTALESQLATPQPATPQQRIRSLLRSQTRESLSAGSLASQDRQALVEDLNRMIAERVAGDAGEPIYREDDFQSARPSRAVEDLVRASRSRMSQARKEHINRSVLEDALNRDGEVLAKHVWDTPRRRMAHWSQLVGNANLALLMSAVIAMLTLKRSRGLTTKELAAAVETSLMSGGVIILITAAGGAFGAMLDAAQIGPAIKSLFPVPAGGGTLLFLLMGFLIAAVLKVAQGSSTVAMIIGSGMMAAIVTPEQLGCHPVYLATSIGGGSLVGSWMNDSGFWIFAKMGVLTEPEALKSWTVMLVVLGLVSLAVSMVLAVVAPLV